ncbi:MAG: collagen-like protein [Magnetococcales bacterium]|nr:collagen-like protein [Magnetococcales bacterium]
MLPQTVSDADDNGGRMSATEVASGVANNVWPDVPPSERLSGSTRWRKLFVKVASPYNLKLIDARIFLQAPTPAGDRVVFCAGTPTDVQGDLSGSEAQYGSGVLNENIAPGGSVVRVAVESALDDIFHPGQLIRLSNKTSVNDLVGIEEFAHLSAVAWNNNQATLTLDAPLQNGFSVSDTRVASVLEAGHVWARTDAWALSSAAGRFGGWDGVDSPPSILVSSRMADHIAGIEQNWTLVFTGSSTFTCVGDTVVEIGDGSVDATFAPTNPDFFRPYFSISVSLWSGTWAVGDTLSFATHPAAIPVWEKRIIPPNTTTLSGDKVALIVAGASEYVGSEGAVGPVGPRGLPGATGPQGDPGATIRYGDGVPDNGMGATGDLFIRTDIHDLYFKSVDGWGSPVMNFRGAQGPTGENGASVLSGAGVPADLLGAEGDHYIDFTNYDWYTKTSGGWGAALFNIQGTTGNPGLPGTPGAMWHTGLGLPADSMGVQGDLYLRGENGAVYTRNATTWSETGISLKGADGTGTGNVLKAASSTVDNLVVFGNASGDQLKESGKAIANVSFIDTAETRSAPIDMADNVVQRAELKDWSETRTTPYSSGSSLTLDLETGSVFEVTLGTDNLTTVTFTNPPASGKAGSFTLILTQAATARTVTWPGSVRWPGGSLPDLSTVSSVHILSFLTIDAGAKWYGFNAGKNMAVAA